MAKAKTKKFNQYLVTFDFYFLTSFSKKKSMLKIQLFSPLKSPDESVGYIYGIVGQAFKEAFNKTEFNKNVIRFTEFKYLSELPTEIAKSNFGITDEDKVKSLSAIFKKHLLV